MCNVKLHNKGLVIVNGLSIILANYCISPFYFQKKIARGYVKTPSDSQEISSICLRNQLITAGLVLRHTEKSCIAPYYRHFPTILE